MDDVASCARSEEDQVKRSVFSRALRRLATSTTEERFGWAAEVRRIASLEALRKPKGSEKRLRDDVEVATPPDEVIFIDTVANPEDLPSQSPPPPPTATTTNIDQTTDKELTVKDATECVAAFLRQLLDKTVGLNLDTLNAQALAFLCVMLRISPNPPKGKSTLYTLLANFHFQECEKIGKRVISNKTALLHAQQDLAAMAALQKSTKPKAPTAAGAVVSSSSGSKEATVATPPAPVKAQQKSGKQQAPSASIVDDVQLDVLPEQKVLRRREKEVELHVPTPMRSAQSSDALDDETLRRKVMTLVQILDPVTLQTICRKLCDQLGAVCNAKRVEGTLHALAADGILLYENGIAYFAG